MGEKGTWKRRGHEGGGQERGRNMEDGDMDDEGDMEKKKRGGRSRLVSVEN